MIPHSLQSDVNREGGVKVKNLIIHKGLSIKQGGGGGDCQTSKLI